MKNITVLFIASILFIQSDKTLAAEPVDSVLYGAGELSVCPLPLSQDKFSALSGLGDIIPPDSLDLAVGNLNPCNKPKRPMVSLYELPYSFTHREKDWKRLWINTSVFAGAYIGTLIVLECLPEDATNWNRAEIQSVPPFNRWWNNIMKHGPEIDGDNPVFNYILHPYAGAVYFMAARSCGFNFYQSLLYSACVSTIGWEFGIEGFMERASIQDIFITPIVGSALGECFYLLKRHIVSHDYTLWGSRILGNVVAFLIDPVNEVVGYIAGNPARDLHLGRKAPKLESSLSPAFFPSGHAGFTFSCRF